MSEPNKGVKKKRRGMDLGRVLLWSAVLVSAPRWAGAMLAADIGEISPWLNAALNAANTFSGLGMGLLEVVATAYLLDAVRQLKPTVTVRRKSGTVDRLNWRFYGVLVFAAGLLALTPLILGPYMVGRMTGESMAQVLGGPGWQLAWSIAVVISPVFIIGGVAFAQPGLVTMRSMDEAPKVSAKISENEGKKVKEEYGGWRQVPPRDREKIAELVRSRSKREAMEEVRHLYGVEERTAYNWLRYAVGMSEGSKVERGDDGDE